MTYLLSADWHLDDNPANEYRWQVFNHVKQAIPRHGIGYLFVLGDIVDRRDRHSASFVNRLMDELRSLSQHCGILILRGNHDTTLRSPCYFDWLDEKALPNVMYVSRPVQFNSKIMMLPFTANPAVDWKGLPLSQYDALFMHVTYPGAVAENGQKLPGTKLPRMRSKVYSGDVHTPQRFGDFVHVGAPHPVKFGDSYPCRMLVIDQNTLEITREVRLNPLRKIMLDIHDVGDLEKVRIAPGDQVKLRFHCQPSDIDGFGKIERRIATWADAHKAVVAGTEVIVSTEYNREVDVEQTPEAILMDFAKAEGLSDAVLETGLRLLRKVTQR